MDARAEELIKQGDNLFSKRSSLLNLWQEIAENFYPLRADFTNKITPGDDLTSHLSNSYPVLAHRDLSNSFSTMLRRRGTTWFGVETGHYGLRTGHEDIDNGESRKWLDWASEVQYRAMYDRKAQFVRATKEGDQDFAAFGQAVIQVERNRDGNTLLFRDWHLRDVAWAENAEGEVDTVHRKWKPTAIDLMYTFGNKNHPEVKKKADGKDPYQELDCRHIMVPTERAGDVPAREKKFRFRSYYVDVTNRHVIEEVPSHLLTYVIPRWQTVSGSAYAYSPAAITALPDARLIQSMTYTLLDAGEKAAQPPMIGQAQMIKSNLELWSGGVTWVDAEYDERLGEALRPIPQDYSGLPFGAEMARDAKEMIREAFFLDKLTLPEAGSSMTAYETSQRIQEYIRQALPLFEPMEQEYNGGLCDMTFATMMQAGAFGDPRDMPEELRGAEVEFKFTSPLQENEDRKDTQIYMETKALLADAAAMEPDLFSMVDSRKALRDAIKGAGAPARWMRNDDAMNEIAEARAEQQEQEQMMNDLQRGGEVAEQIGKGAAAMGVMDENQAV